MKEVINVSLTTTGDPYYGYHISESALKKLAKKFPESLTKFGGISFSREAGSVELLEFCKTVEEVTGLRPARRFYPYGNKNKRKEFSCDGSRIFTKEEIISAEFAEISPRYSYCDSNRYSDDGVAIVERKDIKQIPMGGGGRCETFVNDALKLRIEVVGFTGLSFRPVIVEGRLPVKDVEPVWQLWSDFVMPLMENPKSDREGNPVDLDHDGMGGCFINEILMPAMVRYTGNVLESCKGMDIVRTVEHFGSDGLRAKRVPRLLCSKRFRNWCALEKLKVAWNPVMFGSRE